jgi:hypothetical protein
LLFKESYALWGSSFFQKLKVEQVYVKKYKRICGNLKFNP